MPRDNLLRIAVLSALASPMIGGFPAASGCVVYTAGATCGIDCCNTTADCSGGMACVDGGCGCLNGRCAFFRTSHERQVFGQFVDARLAIHLEQPARLANDFEQANLHDLWAQAAATSCARSRMCR